MTNNQRLIIDLIIKHQNDYVGWNENAYSDTGTTWSKNPSIQGCEDYIYNMIINSIEKYQETENGEMIETKHIRFEGSDWLKLAIKLIVEATYIKGWHFPHAK